MQPGTVVSSRYEVRRFLGRGGMGDVYLAFDRELDETVALKLLRPELSESPDMDARFRREIKLARRVRHRNVCAIHEFGLEGALRFIAMEYIEGLDLRAHLRQTGALPVSEAVEIAAQVADGLQAIHEAGIVHRDLKTPNIMRDAKGVVRVMDFGIAKQVDADASFTAVGKVIGTPEYMSPEQASGQRVDARSDIYALGVVLFELATGRVPFHADSPLATLMLHLTEPPPLDHGDAERLPGALRDVLRGCLAKAAQDRYPTAGDVARALRGSAPAGTPAPSDSLPITVSLTGDATPIVARPAVTRADTEPSRALSAGQPIVRRWTIRALAVAGTSFGVVALGLAAMSDSERLACTAAGLAAALVTLSWFRRLAWPFSSRARSIGLLYGVVVLTAAFAFSLGNLDASNFASGLVGVLAVFAGALHFLAEQTAQVILTPDAVTREKGLPVPSHVHVPADAIASVIADVRDDPAEARIVVADESGARVVVDSTLDAVPPQALSAWLDGASSRLVARAEGELRAGRAFRCGPIQLQRDQVVVPRSSRRGASTLARWVGGGFVAASALAGLAAWLARSALAGVAALALAWLLFSAVGVWRVRRWKVRPLPWSEVRFRLESGQLHIDTAQGSVAVAASLIPNAYLLPRLTATPRSASVTAAR